MNLKDILIRPPVADDPLTDYQEAYTDTGHYNPWYTEGRWFVLVILLGFGLIACTICHK
jgi:hypothetical protein